MSLHHSAVVEIGRMTGSMLTKVRNGTTQPVKRRDEGCGEQGFKTGKT